MNEISSNEKIVHNYYNIEVFIDPLNKRIRVDDYRGNLNLILEKIEKMSSQFLAEKLIFIGKYEHFPDLIQRGFLCEAMVDGYFHGSHAYYFTKYFVSDRKQGTQWINEDKIVKNVSLLERKGVNAEVPGDYELIKIKTEDAESLAKLYQNVFRIYPTPLNDPDYIRKTIEQGTIYYAFVHVGNMVSAASAEINSVYYNAELTDCATLSSHRKFGLMKILLKELETDLRGKGIFCAYSIARAQSFGMNAALHQLGYAYRGRLTNNCYIYDQLENMNMWVKDLSKA